MKTIAITLLVLLSSTFSLLSVTQASSSAVSVKKTAEHIEWKEKISEAHKTYYYDGCVIVVDKQNTFVSVSASRYDKNRNGTVSQWFRIVHKDDRVIKEGSHFSISKAIYNKDGITALISSLPTASYPDIFYIHYMEAAKQLPEEVLKIFHVYYGLGE